MELNLKGVHTALQGTGVGVRPHVKTHKCPQIAKMQIAAGAVGVCTAKVSESEVMLENGIGHVLMTGVNVTVPKIQKAMAVAKKHRGFIQAIDNPQNAYDLQDAARAAGIVADVVVEMDVIKKVRRYSRSSCPCIDPLVSYVTIQFLHPSLIKTRIIILKANVKYKIIGGSAFSMEKPC
jgi:D-serine deaminase-like pyridoxal phosphate-dependent protein